MKKHHSSFLTTVLFFSPIALPLVGTSTSAFASGRSSQASAIGVSTSGLVNSRVDGLNCSLGPTPLFQRPIYIPDEFVNLAVSDDNYWFDSTWFEYRNWNSPTSHVRDLGPEQLMKDYQTQAASTGADNGRKFVKFSAHSGSVSVELRVYLDQVRVDLTSYPEALLLKLKEEGNQKGSGWYPRSNAGTFPARFIFTRDGSPLADQLASCEAFVPSFNLP